MTLLFLVASCQSQPKAAAGGAAMNSVCPISGEAIEAGSPSVDYMGHKVAFCCDNCVGKWNKMDDAARQAAYAKLTK